MKVRTWTVVLACLSAVTLAACGSSGSDSNTGGASGTTSTTTTSGGGSAPSGAAAALWKQANPKCGDPANFVGYVCGKPGAADPSAKPALIGWVNNQDGSIVSEGPQATSAAQLAVNWINKNADGIDGHPLKLVTCYIKNSEEEGKACADQFLANKNIHVYSYGSAAVGAQTVNGGINGSIPLIEGFANNPSDVTQKNAFILFTATPYDYYAWGTFGQDVAHAKTAAIVYPQGTGFQNSAVSAETSLKAVGIKVKSVGYAPTSTNLVGALVAAGAPTADMVVNVGGTPATCLAIEKGVRQLKIPDDKVIGDFSCGLESEKEGYGGDLPKWYFGEAQSGDALTNSPVGVQYRAALAQAGATSHTSDVWYSGMFGVMATIAQFMNKVGYDKLHGNVLAEQAKTFRGPLLLGEPHPYCGKYPDAPANCGGGDRFFKYLGNDKYQPVSAWSDVPQPLQVKLHAKGT
jgi:ABC-type branched-subunit amino acid transport system substrate-binding protein